MYVQLRVHLGAKSQVLHHYKSHKMALWNDLIPRLYRPRVVTDQRSTVPSASTARQQASSSPSSLSPAPDTSTLAAMERDGGGVTKAMSAAGQDRKSHDRKSHDRKSHNRKSHDLQHDTDIATDAEDESNDDNEGDVRRWKRPEVTRPEVA